MDVATTLSCKGEAAATKESVDGRGKLAGDEEFSARHLYAEPHCVCLCIRSVSQHNTFHLDPSYACRKGSDSGRLRAVALSYRRRLPMATHSQRHGLSSQRAEGLPQFRTEQRRLFPGGECPPFSTR